MVTKVVPGLLIATDSLAEAAREAAGRFARAIQDAIRDRGQATIALSGGNAPLGAYRLLSEAPIDWQKVRVYWVDERAVPPTHERSNYGAAKKALLDPAGIPEANVFRMRGEAPDLAASAAEYEASLRETIDAKQGGIPCLDLVVLGVGTDGHTASFFPKEPTVHVVDRLVASVPAKEGRDARLTLTAPMLETARASVVVVLGKEKHPALELIWAANGDLAETPGRIIRNLRGSICWVIDRAAGGMG